MNSNSNSNQQGKINLLGNDTNNLDSNSNNNPNNINNLNNKNESNSGSTSVNNSAENNKNNTNSNNCSSGFNNNNNNNKNNNNNQINLNTDNKGNLITNTNINHNLINNTAANLNTLNKNYIHSNSLNGNVSSGNPNFNELNSFLCKNGGISSQNLNSIKDKLKNNPIWANMNAADRAAYEKSLQINHEMPDLSLVKSKIDTGSLVKKPKEIIKEIPNDELDKKYNQIQKENQEKLKDYRDLVLKMKQEKRKNTTKEVKDFF